MCILFLVDSVYLVTIVYQQFTSLRISLSAVETLRNHYFSKSILLRMRRTMKIWRLYVGDDPI